MPIRWFVCAENRSVRHIQNMQPLLTVMGVRRTEDVLIRVLGVFGLLVLSSANPAT